MEASMIMDATSLTPTSSPSSGRKRNRENETPSQRMKREKAAERQRRKRERDRLGIPVNYVHPPPQRNPPTPGSLHSPVPPPPPPLPPQQRNEPQLTPEEEARRDRVRAAARDRQRKHRALVKQRKMRELGMDMGNDIAGGPHGSPVGTPGQISYAVDPQAGFHAAMISPPPPGMIQQSVNDDPNGPFAPNLTTQGHGGQMFATTLLLSFSCAPLLKQHLLNSLQMSNEELASLEPIIADAWDQWDRQRRQPQQPFDASQPPYAAQQSFVPNQPSSAPPDVNSSSATANEFRARFHRSLVVPTPFQAQAAAAAVAVAQAQANAAAHAAASQSTVPGSINGITEEEGAKVPKSDHN